MVQRREKLRFPFESRQTLAVFRQLFGQDFDRDFATELGVARPVDLSHPTCANGRNNLELTQAPAD